MSTNYNIRITHDGFFQLFKKDIPFSEICLGILKLTNDYYLFKTKEGNKIFNTTNESEYFLGENYLNININYLRYTEDNKFKFIDFEPNIFTTFEINVGKDEYNIVRSGQYLLYEQKLYKKNQFLVDLNSLSAIEYNDKYLLFNFEQIVIITDKKVKIQLFCFLTDLISDQIINITINKQVLIKTSSDDYIFNSDGSLLFKGNFGEYLSDGPIKVLNEKGEYLWFDNKLIGPISGFIFDKINICYSNKNRIVIIEDDNLLDINLDESDFKIYKSNIKDLKLAKIGWKTVKLSKFDESIFILTDGVMYYYFNFIDNQFNEYPFGIQIFDFSNGKLSWMSFDGGKIDFSLDYEKILDFSYLDDDLLIVAQKSDEYYLISTKNGIIKKGKKPFAFHRNWGGYVMIDPQPGKKIDLFYYDDLHNKLYHFPFKLSGVDLKKRDSQFQISLDSLIPFISVEFQKFNNPIAY